jgi:hypothetical protein
MLSRMRFLLILAILLSSQTIAQQPRVQTQVLPQYDSLFTRSDGWTGADGAYSVALSNNLTLWLYSDSWIGRVRANRHINSTMINNSVGIQYGRNPLTAQLRFFYGSSNNGAPTALITPADGRGWFWLYHGILTSRGLYLFLMQIERTPDGGFRHIGVWLGHVANPFDVPSAWRITQRRLPFGRFSAQGDTLFGSAILRDGGYIYIYGADEDIEDGWYHRKYMVVARVREEHLDDFNRWRFYTNGRWQPYYTNATRICDNIANEYSVSFQPSLNRYVLIYTENGLSRNIALRVAPTPYGSWSDPVMIYQCPETDWHKNIVCYAAKGHPSLSTEPDELIVTYIASSSNFFQIMEDARLYRPRFLRLKLSLL